jgi:hypothetical protein
MIAVPIPADLSHLIVEIGPLQTEPPVGLGRDSEPNATPNSKPI